MALIFDGMKCPICSLRLGKEDLFATWGVFLPPDDPLWRYCDAGMHWECYEGWTHRERFARAYFQFWVDHERMNPVWGKAFCNDDMLVTLNPQPPIEEVSIRFAITGSDLRIKLERWSEWLKNPASVGLSLRTLEKEALHHWIAVLRAQFPTPEALVNAVDWKHKMRMAEQNARQVALRESEKQRVIAIHNAACRVLEVQRTQEGLTCGNCKQHSRDFRFMNKFPDRKWYFICNQCSHTVEPDPALSAEGV